MTKSFSLTVHYCKTYLDSDLLPNLVSKLYIYKIMRIAKYSKIIHNTNVMYFIY